MVSSALWEVRARRAGATLLECVVALVLLGAGLAAVAATSTAALRVLGLADAELAAITLGAGVLDSLALNEAPTSGTLTRGPLRAEWRVSPAAVGLQFELAVRNTNGQPRFEAAGRAARWPRRLPILP